MAKKHQHVVPHNKGWGVRKEGNPRITKAFETQRAAIDFGRGAAKKDGSELKIHGKDGKIRESWSYGNDPYPPKG